MDSKIMIWVKWRQQILFVVGQENAIALPME